MNISHKRIKQVTEGLFSECLSRIHLTNDVSTMHKHSNDYLGRFSGIAGLLPLSPELSTVLDARLRLEEATAEYVFFLETSEVLKKSESPVNRVLAH